MAMRGDEELQRAMLRRDEAALKEVIDRFGEMVYGMARRVVADPSLAEEVAQDTFVALWRRPGAFDPARGQLKAFLLGIARNKAVDLVRREESLRRTRQELQSEAEAQGRASETSADDEHMVDIESRQGIRDALAQLSSVQREALFLAYYGGRTYREVAHELDIPEGTAKTRLRDGLLKLRQLLASYRGT